MKLKNYVMKNLRKLSKRELKSVNGGIPVCIQDCLVGYTKCCTPGREYYCTPNGTKCGGTI